MSNYPLWVFCTPEMIKIIPQHVLALPVQHCGDYGGKRKRKGLPIHWDVVSHLFTPGSKGRASSWYSTLGCPLRCFVRLRQR